MQLKQFFDLIGVTPKWGNTQIDAEKEKQAQEDSDGRTDPVEKDNVPDKEEDK